MTDAVRELLRGRGCPEDVVAGGIDGLLEAWEACAAEVEKGYRLGLDDYLNDLDTRQLLADALAVAPAPPAAVRRRLEAADERMKRAVEPARECLWGKRMAELEGWTPERQWWYFSVPRKGAETVREDLAGR